MTCVMCKMVLAKSQGNSKPGSCHQRSHCRPIVTETLYRFRYSGNWSSVHNLPCGISLADNATWLSTIHKAPRRRNRTRFFLLLSRMLTFFLSFPPLSDKADKTGIHHIMAEHHHVPKKSAKRTEVKRGRNKHNDSNERGRGSLALAKG